MKRQSPNKYKGFGRIFKFTFAQRAKMPGYRRATIGGALLCFLLPLIIMGCVEAFSGNDQKKQNQVTTVYVTDETGQEADYNILNEIGREGYTEINYIASPDFETANDQAGSVENSAVLVVKSSEEAEQLSIVLPSVSNLSQDDLQGLKDFLTSAYPYVQMQKTGLDPEELTALTAPVQVSSHKAVDEKEDSLAQIREIMAYVFPYMNVMVLYFLVLFYGQGVSASVLMEKTSKLMDTFLLYVQ
ncbi:MAG: ABC transporter permease, partial [Lachnospiraceae bacterium]|nr:ABC transporter permease [Lachnospiraceae bacterium]